MSLIGIAYASRVGKDTAADALVRDLGYTKFAFAAPLKELALAANPLALPSPGLQNVQTGHNRLKWLVQCDGWERAKDRYPAVRQFLEDLGNGARKVFGEDFWRDIALARAAKVGNAVISDVRFLNEFEGIREAGGQLVKITRPGFNARPFEQELSDLPDDEWDLVVVNDGSVIDLEAKIVAWAKTAFKSKAAA
jgi:hypothetical protein